MDVIGDLVLWLCFLLVLSWGAIVWLLICLMDARRHREHMLTVIRTWKPRSSERTRQ